MSRRPAKPFTLLSAGMSHTQLAKTRFWTVLLHTILKACLISSLPEKRLGEEHASRVRQNNGVKDIRLSETVADPSTAHILGQRALRDLRDAVDRYSDNHDPANLLLTIVLHRYAEVSASSAWSLINSRR
jgi:hypothetical protein